MSFVTRDYKSKLPVTAYRGLTPEDMEWTVLVERMGVAPEAVGVTTKQRYYINWRLDLMNHSPTGLAWGYLGSGPAQCALAILADYLQDDQRALRLYQDFKLRVIARFDKDSTWELTPAEIDQVITEIENRQSISRRSAESVKD